MTRVNLAALGVDGTLGGPGGSPLSSSVVSTTSTGIVGTRNGNQALRDWVSVKDYGATGDGSTDDTTAIQNAISSLSSGGRLLFPAGTYVVSSTLTADSLANVVLEGASPTSPKSSLTSGASTILYTGTASPIISAHHTLGLTIRGLISRQNNASFTGKFIEGNADGAASGADTQYLLVDQCSFAGTGTLTPGTPGGVGAFSAAAGVSLNQTINSEVRRCQFWNMTAGVVGVNGAYSNVITVAGCQFNNITVAPIQTPGQSWSIPGNTFEGVFDLATGKVKPGLLAMGSAVTVFSPTILGNWCGDVPTGATGENGSWIDFSGATSFVGGMIAGNYFGGTGPAGAGSGILLGAGQGISIMGNRFEGFLAVDFAGSTVFNPAIIGNDLQTTHSLGQAGVAPATVTSYPSSASGLVFLGNHNNSADLTQGFKTTVALTTPLLLGMTTTSTAPGAGGAGALPATPAGYVTVSINGTNRQIPFY